MSVPNTLNDIITKVRRITARPSPTQISDQEIIRYVNTFYIYDFPEHLKLEPLRVNYQFLTKANVPVYDFPTDLYLTVMPPVFIGGYQSYMTQSRENFFRINPELTFLQQAIATGNGTNTFSGTLMQTPILQGFKPNPPGAYSTGSSSFIAPKFINWNVLLSALGNPDPVSGIEPSISLVDDGQGNLFFIDDPDCNPANRRGTIDYMTGAVNVTNFPVVLSSQQTVNAQYVPYVPSRPQSCVFFQDQIALYPIPDQAYTVSFEAYKYPVSFTINPNGTFDGTLTPQLTEWWQLLAYGAADKIFSDNADLDSMMKFRPLMEEQMNLVLRRTIVQQTSERIASIYTEQSNFPAYPFGNLFSGF